MIKAAGKAGDGKRLLLLGLSDENVKRLKADQPILIKAEDLAELGFQDMHIAIVYGSTEEEIMERIQEST